MKNKIVIHHVELLKIHTIFKIYKRRQSNFRQQKKIYRFVCFYNDVFCVVNMFSSLKKKKK